MKQAVSVEILDETTGEWKPAGDFKPERDDFTGYRRTARLVIYTGADRHE